MLIDILVAQDEDVRTIIQDAVEAESEEGKIMLANKKGVIWLKRTRDSKQDQDDRKSTLRSTTSYTVGL